MRQIRLSAAVLTALALTLPASAAAAADDQPATGLHQNTALRDAAPSGFVIGSAVAGGGHHQDEDYPDPFTGDQEYRRILGEEFSSLSAENQMKWDHLRPSRDGYAFDDADAIVAYAQDNGQDVRGHTLLWHSQNPDWLENGNFSQEELREILRDHIETVVGRYAGQIHQWDVANEIFDDGGNLRTGDNIWIRELGVGIVGDAFRWAHAADPSAELYFNDYNVEDVNAKSDAYYELTRELLAEGVPVHGFSAQTHLSLQYGFPSGLQTNLERFEALGLSTALTEVDVRMQLPGGAEPTEQQLADQADYYARALEACLNVSGCDSFTVWGFPDKYSWVPNTFEGEGGATVYWDDYTTKPAYDALLETLLAAG
ncbi:endo-1,4-beta-xylanase [Nocardiopsis ganjiahuensis]|uniref:endo-1,4-beta-xylanase n=1 Tax=Nocardiopsis ganjiahuensis TaxID=239984 RepID=UPI0003474FDF|nr:endo-1,4-beta-xylanase [Nocardiopsis ganjiahuensis]